MLLASWSSSIEVFCTGPLTGFVDGRGEKSESLVSTNYSELDSHTKRRVDVVFPCCLDVRDSKESTYGIPSRSEPEMPTN